MIDREPPNSEQPELTTAQKIDALLSTLQQAARARMEDETLPFEEARLFNAELYRDRVQLRSQQDTLAGRERSSIVAFTPRLSPIGFIAKPAWVVAIVAHQLGIPSETDQLLLDLETASHLPTAPERALVYQDLIPGMTTRLVQRITSPGFDITLEFNHQAQAAVGQAEALEPLVSPYPNPTKPNVQ